MTGLGAKISPASCSGSRKPRPLHSTASHKTALAWLRAACSLPASRL